MKPLLPASPFYLPLPPLCRNRTRLHKMTFFRDLGYIYYNFTVANGFLGIFVSSLRRLLRITFLLPSSHHHSPSSSSLFTIYFATPTPHILSYTPPRLIIDELFIASQFYCYLFISFLVFLPCLVSPANICRRRELITIMQSCYFDTLRFLIIQMVVIHIIISFSKIIVEIKRIAVLLSFLFDGHRGVGWLHFINSYAFLVRSWSSIAICVHTNTPSST